MKTSCLFFAFFLSCFFSYAQSSSSIKAKAFSIPEYDEKGKLTSIIRGETGFIFGKEALINGATVEIRGGKTPLLLTTPKCKYLMKDKRCTSKDAVEVVGDGIKITGVGFDIDNNTRKIFIRSKVKVIWKKANIKRKLDKPSKKTEKKK